jgi:hypothetical protein
VSTPLASNKKAKRDHRRYDQSASALSRLASTPAAVGFTIPQWSLNTSDSLSPLLAVDAARSETGNHDHYDDNDSGDNNSL